MKKNGKKKKYLCSECYKEYVKHPDVLCEYCYEKYVLEVQYPDDHEAEGEINDSNKR